MAASKPGAAASLGEGVSPASADSPSWDGTPSAFQVTRNGSQFVNSWCPPPPGFFSFFSTVIGGMITGRFKNRIGLPSAEELDRTLPVQTPDKAKISQPPEPGQGVAVTWLGHATTLIQMDNTSVLTDPVWARRAGPFGFGPLRYRPPPCPIEELPTIDACVVSHDHYDHMDTAAIKRLSARFPDLQWFVPEGSRDVLQGAGVSPGSIHELTWWQTVEHKNVKYTLVPCQHWCKRGVSDACKRLWGSWVVTGPSSRAFFSGDTGYCGVFKDVGDRYGPFDFAAIAIGAYEPRELMKDAHVNVEEAVQMHRDLRCRHSLGMHWGTYPMTFEPYMEPKTKLEEVKQATGLPSEEFVTLQHGETRLFE
eukprot:m.83241 g.83241  ORF g.83241 m.83241 type:complete len:365 (+) comp14965_c0_seq1:128-1222(+)